MSASRHAIDAVSLGKCYHIYARPRDRLKQALLPGNRDYFTPFWALRALSLQVPPGETLGIIGRNGSGKSTLLQMICGIVTPTAGDIRVAGRVAAILELGSGFHPEFTGRENARLNAKLQGLTDAQIDARLPAIAAFAELGDFFDQPVKSFSSGMYVRLGFSVMAHVDADILVIDEALAVGDVFFVQKCIRFLRDFQKRGGTIVMVSHDAAAITTLCTRALWLDGGAAKALGSPKAVLQDYLAAAHGFPHETAATTEPPVPIAAPDYGARGAAVIAVRLVDCRGHAVSTAAGGEQVTVHVLARADRPLHSAIVGFFVRDRLGQNLFGDNTHRCYGDRPVAVNPGENFAAHFSFTMPTLPAGDYTIAVAVAEGSQQTHTLEHWVHDALCFHSIANGEATGLVGIPMSAIHLAAGGPDA